MKFDNIPSAQRRHSNSVGSAFLLISAIFFIVLGLYVPLLKYVFFVLTASCLFGIYEVRLELYRIQRIVNMIQGKRDSRKQYAKGRYRDSEVEFFIGKPPSFNYTIIIDGHHALQKKTLIHQFVKNELKQNNIKGYKLLINDNAIVLSKWLILSFQIKVDEAELIYNTLDCTKSKFFDKPCVEAQQGGKGNG
ncbi:MAG: hypothetical protein ACYSWZ_03160 [Planctomycetota bacterium]